MRYIRFVKAPTVHFGNDGRASHIDMKVTITSDLGDTFYPELQSLEVQLFSQPIESCPIGDDFIAARTQRELWKPGMRELSLCLDLSVCRDVPSKAANPRCLVHVTVSSGKPVPDVFAAPKLMSAVPGNVISLWSDYFYPGSIGNLDISNLLSRGKKRLATGAEKPIKESGDDHAEQKTQALNKQPTKKIQRRFKSRHQNAVTLHIWESGSSYAEHIW